MKILHLIGSSISLDNNFPLKVDSTRSFFTKEERARQTYNTIYSILALRPQDTICLIDSSLDDVEPLLIQSNLIKDRVQRYYIKDIDPSLAQTITTHHNKSYGESLMFKSFLTRYQESLSQFDFIIKQTGRYFVDNSFNLDILNEETTNQIFFKHPIIHSEGTITVPTVLYAWGKDQTQTIINMYDFMLEVTKTAYTDGELLVPKFFQVNQITPYNVDWKINGWGGQDGNFYRY